LVYDQADRFLVKLRDEAHRFSNSYRKQQMKNELKSEFKKVGN
jgi:excinuclease UvrABC nuclease subunit